MCGNNSTRKLTYIGNLTKGFRPVRNEKNVGRSIFFDRSSYETQSIRSFGVELKYMYFVLLSYFHMCGNAITKQVNYNR